MEEQMMNYSGGDSVSTCWRDGAKAAIISFPAQTKLLYTIKTTTTTTTTSVSFPTAHLHRNPPVFISFVVLLRSTVKSKEKWSGI